jgi:hypothetical protein
MDLKLSDFIENILPEQKSVHSKKPIKIETLSLDEYLNLKLDINIFWKLCNGLQFIEQHNVQYNRDYFNRFLIKISLPEKYRLCKSFDQNETNIADTSNFTDISEYNLNICKIFEKNKYIFPLIINSELKFYPILSPNWLIDGDPKLGYINLSIDWINNYVTDIKQICLDSDEYYKTHKYLNNIDIDIYYNSINLDSYVLKKILIESKTNIDLKIKFCNFVKKQKSILEVIKKSNITNGESYINLLKLIYDGTSNIQELYTIFNPI